MESTKSTIKMLISFTMSAMIQSSMQIIGELVMTYYWFGFPPVSTVLLMTILLLMLSWTGIAFGLLVSAITSDIVCALFLLIGNFFSNILLCGVIWPIEGKSGAEDHCKCV